MKAMNATRKQTQQTGGGIMGVQKLRLTKQEVCHILSVSISGLASIMEKDDSFPKPYKHGSTRQAAVYFDHSELVAWWEEKKQTRYS